MQEIYISVDIEADGPIPGPHSMLSLGAVALLPTGKEVGSFEVNLELLEGATGHPDTMAWWATQGPAWDACRSNLKSPVVGMTAFVDWVGKVSAGNSATPVCVAYPAGFDFMFIYWYMIKFAGKSPFSFSCQDVKSYASAVLKLPYRKATKKNMPKAWFKGLPPHTHVAIDDAREQGLLFINMLKSNV
jgi:hypothetical protein